MSPNPDITDERFLALLIHEEAARIRKTLSVARDGESETSLDASELAERLEGLIGSVAAANIRLSIVEQLLVEDAHGRAGLSSSPRALITVDQLSGLRNLGPIEQASDGSLMRWTGPEPTTSFELPLPRDRDCELSIRVAAWASRRQMRRTRLAIDGTRAPFVIRRYYGGESVICRLPAGKEPLVRTRLVVSVPPEETRDGLRGVAIGEIRVSPRPDMLRRALRYVHWQRVASLLGR